MIRTHIFDGRRYKIYAEAIDGLCDVPDTKDLELHIFADLKTKDGLETCCHEALHAASPSMLEDSVDRISKDIGSFLWRLNYRHVEGKK